MTLRTFRTNAGASLNGLNYNSQLSYIVIYTGVGYTVYKSLARKKIHSLLLPFPPRGVRKRYETFGGDYNRVDAFIRMTQLIYTLYSYAAEINSYSYRSCK